MESITEDSRLLASWDWEKNLLHPSEVKPFSNKKVWWVCHNGHSWEAVVASRSKGHGCPYCAGQRVLPESCLAATSPSILSQWHPTKNGKLSTKDVAPWSNKKAWWLCEKGHEWEDTVNHRSSGRGCPYCSGRKVCLDNCLSTINPALASEWHPTKNGDLTPKDATHGANKKVWWACSNGHCWQESICNRSKGRGCPYCSNRRVCAGNCLATVNPVLASEWHPSKNGKITPSSITPGCNSKAWWLCSEGHEWLTRIAHRANGAGCPYCSGGPVSAASQEWLDSLGIPEEFREYPIKLPGKKWPIRVDGFDPKTCTVYEFLGNYWHGNPDLYDSKGVNPTSKKTFGALYNQTMRRLERLRKAGYTVVFIWERDFEVQLCTDYP